MTVCIAAMASDGEALVLCADRQRTGPGDMRHEGRIAKKREVGYGWCFLYEDNGTRADALRDEIQDRLRIAYGFCDFPSQEERREPMSEREIINDVQQEFIKIRDKTLQSGVLPTDAKALDLGLLVVGFSENEEAAGVRFFDNGDYETIREVGYGVIGSGSDVAEATLSHYGIPMDDPLDRVLYKVYEAKKRADTLITSVGTTTDMWIMTKRARLQTKRVVKDEENARAVLPRIIKSLDEVWRWRSSPPWNAQQEPYGWQRALSEYSMAILRGDDVRV